MNLSDEFRFKTAESPADAKRLKAHFTEVYFEGVGNFIETLFHRFPRMKESHWFYAEKKTSREIVSAFLLQPWFWEMDGVKLKVAQMAGATTLPEFRRRGLIRELIKCFEQTVAAEEFDLVVINGIRGLYRQFGFCYAIPVENHVNLALDLIPDLPAEDPYTFRLAEESDIAFLMKQDEAYRRKFSIATFRDEAAWKYLLNDRFHTMYGSEYWLMEHGGKADKFYCRLPLKSHFGGKGLLIGEISEEIHDEALEAMLAFFKRKAMAEEKSFIRFNLHNDTSAVKRATSLGATWAGQSAWQIKISDIERFLTRIGPVLEKRIRGSALKGFTGTFRLDFFKTKHDLLWERGRLTAIRQVEGRQALSLRIHKQLFPILCLGHRNWSELACIWPDVGPNSERSERLVETLFPVTRSWLYEPA